jgi:hypothetical protein
MKPNSALVAFKRMLSNGCFATTPRATRLLANIGERGLAEEVIFLKEQGSGQ